MVSSWSTEWYEFWKDLKALGCCFFCGPCSLAQMLASDAQGESCALVNHVLPAWFCPCCVLLYTRMRVREKKGLKTYVIPKPAVVDDAICTIACPCCSMTQIMRQTGNYEKWVDNVTSMNVKIMKR